MAKPPITTHLSIPAGKGVMSIRTLLFNSLRHYWRSNLAVGLGVALVAVTLSGALSVGTSIKTSLRRTADLRIGHVKFVVTTVNNKMFTDRIADSLVANTSLPVAPIVLRSGSVSSAGGRLRVGNVSIIGVDERFWRMGPAGTKAHVVDNNEAIINRALADKMHLSPGDDVLLHFARADRLPMEAPFSGGERVNAMLRCRVKEIADNTQFGDFSLKAEHGAVYNVFVARRTLARVNNRDGYSSALLLGASAYGSDSVTIGKTIRSGASPEDRGLHIRTMEQTHEAEVYSDDLFVPESLANGITALYPDGRRIFTYFVNSCGNATGSTPYSFVATAPAASGLSGQEILLSKWAADDLRAHEGDTVYLKYFVPTSSALLIEKTAAFSVKAIVPFRLPWADSTLTPMFPGLSQAGSCKGWDAGIPIDLGRIRPKDEKYWKEWRGTPKAFISIDAARRLWKNRFGSCTAIRVPLTSHRTVEVVTREIGDYCNRNGTTFTVDPVRRHIDRSINNGTDFASLFTGMSFFIIVAALILTMLLLTFSLLHRREQMRLFIALGFTRGQITGMTMLEGCAVATIGALLGTAISPLYTALLLLGLQSVWHAAAQVPAFHLSTSMGSLFGGWAGAVVMASGVMWLSMTSMIAACFRGENNGNVAFDNKQRRKSNPVIIPMVLASATTVGLLIYARIAGAAYAAGVYFGVGACMITVMLCAFQALLTNHDRRIRNGRWSFRSLAVNNVCRKKGRSVGTAAIIGCALFIISAMTLFRYGTTGNPHDRSSGAGGFALYGTLTTALPYAQLDFTRLHERGCVDCVPGQAIARIRLRDGDDASCLNLNRVSQPPIAGVDDSLFDRRGSFSFAKIGAIVDKKHPWRALDTSFGQFIIPGIADQNMIEWGLGIKLGDTLHYTDESGSPLHIVLVGGLSATVLQGQVIIGEQNFIRHFPSIGGYRQFLADTPNGKEEAVGSALRNLFPDNGIEYEPTKDRLAAFHAVENTYLDIFTLLGVFGLLLGCAGLGIVVLQNAIERRREFALLRALGYLQSTIRRLVLMEQGIVAGAGIIAGLFAALIAVLPSMRSPGSVEAVVVNMAIMVAAIAATGFCSIWLAVRMAIGNDSIRVLREE